jgi:hypothetical protein
MRHRSLLAITLVVVSLGTVWAQVGTRASEPHRPDVTGEWTGTWGPYYSEPPPKSEAKHEKRLDCTVVRKGDTWQATFEGECGRPYKYTIKMDGRQAGDAVLFKGTTDLGEKDGGVYDWIGRATEKEFVGFYTSAKYFGVFRVARKKG